MQFRLKTLLIVVSVCGLVLGRYAGSAHRQRVAVATIRALGGDVAYDVDERHPSVCRAWLGARLGIDFAGNVVAVYLPLSIESELRELRRAVREDSRAHNVVHFHDDQRSALPVRDEDLAVLRALPRLCRIDADSSPIGDSAVAHLNGFRELRCLNLSFTRVTDRGFARLANPTCEVLRIDGTDLGDAGLKGIGAMCSLRSLSLAGTRVGDAGVAELRHLRRLESLNLRRTKITDHALRLVALHEELRVLNLARTAVTDSGVVLLEGLRNLQELNLDDTRVTSAGLELLKRTMPRCKISCVAW